MTADAAALNLPGAVSRPADAWARDRRFFTGMALAMMLTVFVPIADMAIFSTLVGAGMWFRQRSEIHKRLMLVSTIAILTAAIARLPGVLAGGPLAFFALTDLFVVVGMVYDRMTRGRVHPGYWWGGGLLLASQAGRLALSGTSAWLAFATWLTR